jgi:hypothetical protein
MRFSIRFMPDHYKVLHILDFQEMKWAFVNVYSNKTWHKLLDDEKDITTLINEIELITYEE